MVVVRIRTRFLPLGSVLDRYLAAGFVRIFFATLAIITSLYVTVDLFDRIGTLFESGAPLLTVVRYFSYKAPLLISRVIGFATLFSTLFSLGMLARTYEITAMRSGGISVQRLALPLFIVSLFICVLSFIWNESLVPVFAHRAQTIYLTEIKHKQQKSLLGTHDIWLRGENSFINVDRFDTQTSTLENVTIFRLNRSFGLTGLVEIPKAEWSPKGWKIGAAVEWTGPQAVTVDATVELLERTDHEGHSVMTFSLPEAMAPFVVEKGSVALDGVSLTVATLDRTGAGERITVWLIPHTLEVTTLGLLAPGDRLNFEADVLAKYVARSLEPYRRGVGGGA